MIGIYKITNPKGKIYIGQSSNIKIRFKHYRLCNCKGQPKLYNSLQKYGYKKHVFEVLCECAINDLNKLERYYQELYQAIGKGGLNCVLNSCDNERAVYSEETRLRMSKSLTGKKRSNSTKLKMSIARKNEWDLGLRNNNNLIGKRISDSHKEKLRIVNLGRKMTDEDKLKMRLAKLGKKVRPDILEKRIKSQTGLKRSEKTKERMSLAQKGRKLSESAKQNMSVSSWLAKPIINLETGIFYTSVKTAAKAHDICHSTLCRNLSGQNNKRKYNSFIYA